VTRSSRYIALASVLAFAAVSAQGVSISVEPVPGLANPALRLQLRPGMAGTWLAASLWAATAVYVAVVVGWMTRGLERFSALVPVGGNGAGGRQPPAVRELKDAIRRGDIAAVGDYATPAALAHEDEALLSPFELAEIYGNPAILAILLEAYRRHFGARLPPNRFAGADGSGLEPCGTRVDRSRSGHPCSPRSATL
jgi:hypothetical protein